MKQIKYAFIIGMNFLCTRSLSQLVQNVEAIGITVSDLDRAVDFYTNILSFEKVSEVEVYGKPYETLKGLFGIRYKRVRLRLGGEQIELTDFLTAGGREIPQDSRSNDLWFQHIAIVVSNMDSAYARLRKYHVTHVSTGPQTLPPTIPAAAGVRAFYFHDPDGHNLELIYFPAGKGNTKWQENNSDVFLGIDHTAIAVSQTNQSKKFYSELLGIKYQGESFNFGDEQEHLNNVAGARLHISGNHASHGPGVEFLEYLEPKTGRKYPSDERADDLLHWETIVTTSSIMELYQNLKRAEVTFISKAIVEIPETNYIFSRGFYVRDPDGHVIGVFEKR